MWNDIDKELEKYNRQFIKSRQYLKDDLQDLFDSIKINQKNIYSYASSSEVNKFKRTIEKNMEVISQNECAKYLAERYLSARRIKNNEILQFLILLQYVKNDSSNEEFDELLFTRVSEISYEMAIKECEKIKKPKKISDFTSILIHLMAIANNLGYVWKEYAQMMCQFNAEEIFRQCMMDINRNKLLSINNQSYLNILEKQRKRKLNIGDHTHSGAIENQVDYIANGTYYEVGKEYDIKQCRFIAEIDKRTTDMCESLNNQIFNLNDWNTYQRYSDEDKRYVVYKTFGLRVGDNLPPINNHFHYCRSTITYNINEIIGKENYVDITEEWKSKSLVNRNSKVIIPKSNDTFNYKGTKYNIDNNDVKFDYTQNELNTAKWLSKKINKKIVMLPKINKPEKIQTPDYLIKGEYFDLKTITGTSNQVIYHNIYGKQGQANNFIIDMTNSKLEMVDIKEQISKLFKRKDVGWVNKIVIKKGDYFQIMERK